MFKEQDGKTTVTLSAVFQAKEDRDGMINSGMEYGLNDGWDRLSELFKTMA